MKLGKQQQCKGGGGGQCSQPASVSSLVAQFLSKLVSGQRQINAVLLFPTGLASSNTVGVAILPLALLLSSQTVA